MKRLIMVLASVFACVAATLAMALPAQAAPAQPAAADQTAQPAAGNGCPSNAFCLYTNVNFTGQYVIFTGEGKDCKLTGFHDRASSAINNRNDKVVLFRDVGCGGPSLTVPPGARYANFVDRGFNDKADGIRLG